MLPSLARLPRAKGDGSNLIGTAIPPSFRALIPYRLATLLELFLIHLHVLRQRESPRSAAIRLIAVRIRFDPSFPRGSRPAEHAAVRRRDLRGENRIKADLNSDGADRSAR
jgi:hypothetical protein